MQFNKRGQELSVNTLILIIIGVLILVFLIVGFTIGWKKIFPFVTPANNVKEVVDKCSLACNTQSQYDYCTTPREVRVDQEIAGLGKEFSGSCNELKGVTQLGIDRCPSVSCANFIYTTQALAELSCGGTGKFESTSQPVSGTSDPQVRTYKTGTEGQFGYIKCLPQTTVTQ